MADQDPVMRVVDRVFRKHGVRPRRRRRAKTQRIVDVALEVLGEYRPMTVRQVYYQLVARHIIENKRSQYQAVSIALRDARKWGEIPWEWIEDRLRRPRRVSMWHDLAEFATTAVNSYRRDVWETQEHYVECWLEKDALSGLFEDVLRPYGVTLNVGRGYDGWSSIRNAAMRYLAWERGNDDDEEEPYPEEVLPKTEDSTEVLNEKLRGFLAVADARKAFSANPLKHRPRPVTVLYFGDFDPSGRDMVRSLEKRINFFGTYPKIRISALLRSDIDEYDLPPDFAKKTDSRAASFIAEHGDISVELDALPVTVLLKRLEDSIRDIMDLTALDEVLQAEKEDKSRITLEWRAKS
ncbi:hypothetical protein LCGC14_0275720 [marine sediment metagenome]|uniref:Uncharacterized protein n=1 Tax=marine sediment metagenome TaxID=412755 RepID=A0A0F9WIJ9_9ZZZZ